MEVQGKFSNTGSNRNGNNIKKGLRGLNIGIYNVVESVF